MGAKLDLHSLSHLQNPNPNLSGSGTGSGSVSLSGTGTGSWMWTPRQPMASQEDDDSWEVRAFAEDTGNAMGTTWPPRSYTCTFCRREFRSAQALGGHMNVHRRDRARLHQTQPINSKNATSSSSPTLLIPTHQDLVANGGLCLLYSLPNPNGLFSPSSFHNYREPPSTLLSITQYPPTNNFMPPSPHHIPPVNFPVNINTSHCHSSNSEASASVDDDNKHESNDDNKEDSAIEELDLELRLGRSS